MRQIDADALYETLCHIWDRSDSEEFEQAVFESIVNAPTIEAPKWVLCSERLPEIGQKVLASTKKTVFTQVFKGYYSDPKRWAWGNNRIKRIEAWQPLPMPWEGEG